MSDGAERPQQNRISFNTMAFMAMAFFIVGLTGIFATYAIPIPLERAMAREGALDAALLAAKAPDPTAALAALAPRLDDSFAALAGADAGIEARIARERAAMRARFIAETAATGLRLRWLIGMMTLTATLFGIAMLGSAGRGR